MDASADAAARIADLADIARSDRAARFADRARRIEILAGLARAEFRRTALQARAALEERLAEIDRVGAIPSLFTLMGLVSYEKPYNRVLAWLADPREEHGAGRAVLRKLAERLGPPALLADVLAAPVGVEVRGERAWPGGVESRRMPDFMAVSDHAVLVIENKVEAGESGPDQYADYRLCAVKLAHGRDWAAVLAAPTVRPKPAGWTWSITHRELADLIRSAADEHDVPPWGRVACLLVAAEFEATDGASPTSSEAHRIVEAARDDERAVEHLHDLRRLVDELQPPSPPWRSGER